MPLIVFLAALIVAVLAARRMLAVVTVRGESMRPTLEPGDRLLLLRTPVRKIRRRQVVLLQPPDRLGTWRRDALPSPAAGEWVVKRVAALPGDPMPAEMERDPDAVVPPGTLVVLGDGEYSADSRLWGPVPADRVIGVVARTLASPK